MPEKNQDSPTMKVGRDAKFENISGQVAIGNNNVQYINSTINKKDKTYRYTQGMRPTTDPKTVFGRQKELEKIDELLENCHSLAITGFRGTGKSTLASMYVDRLIEKRNYLGVYWRRMNETTEISDIFGSFFTVIGKPIQNLNDYKHEEDQLSLLFQELETSPYFLVLDNFETLINPQNNELVKPGFSQLIEKANQMSGQSRILYTSWECPTNQTEWYQIGGLDQQAALKLLEHIGITGSESELRLVIERSNGHPQALKLLSPLVKRGYALAEALADESLWKGQVAKQILDKVYSERLSEEERKLLQYVALYREPVPIQAITAVANDANWTEIFTTNLTLNLNMKSLLNKTCDNYWEESLIQSYAYKKMKDSVRRHILAYDYYFSLPVPQKPSKKEDVKTLIEAHHHACMAKEYDKAAEIILRKNLHENLSLWGNYRTLVELYISLLPENHFKDKPLLSKTNDQGTCLGNLGAAYDRLGDYPKAIKYYDQALIIAKEIGDKQREGVWLGNLGLAYNSLGSYQKAVKYIMQALEIAKQIGDNQGEGIWLGNLGLAHNRLADYPKAINYYEQALVIAKEIRDQKGEGTWLGNLGLAYNSLGNYLKAVRYFEQALDIAQQIGDKHNEGVWLGSLGAAHNRLGDYQKAINYIMQALVISRQIGDKLNEGVWLCSLGAAHNNLGEYPKAIEYISQSLAISRQIGDKKGEGVRLGSIGLAFDGSGDCQKAIEYYEQALDIAQQIGDKLNEGVWLGNLGAAYNSLGDCSKVLKYYKQALDIAKQIGNKQNEGILLSNISYFFSSVENKNREALACYFLAKQIFEKFGNPPEIAENESNLKTIKEKLGEKEFTRLREEVEPKTEEILQEIIRESITNS